MIHHRYPTREVVRDYLLSGAGLTLFVTPVALLNLPLVTDLIFSALVLLFLVFGFQVFRRHRTRVEMSEVGLSVVPGGRALPWTALTKLVLSYFAVRRDGERGWMELKLVCPGQVVRLDSRLEGFDEIVARAARAARRNGLVLDRATEANLQALGIHAPEEAPPGDRQR